MLPRSLTVQNFLSYGAEPQTLSFDEFDLACLIGPNGVGKSSLIEALTWGIWGQARSGSDNDLVHQGAKTLSVSIDVDVAGRLYRVVRKRSVRGRGGISLLEFQAEDGGSFQALTAPTIRETQALIDRVFGLSYDTFVNSAYLRQGKADEFTVKRPAERKAILGEILGLGTYGALEERVRAKIALIEQKTSTETLFLAQLQEEIAELPVREAALGESEEQAVTARDALEAAEKSLAEWREKERHLALRQERAAAAATEAAALATDLTALDRDLTELQGRIATSEALLAGRTQLEAELAEAQKAQNALEHWTAKLEQVHVLGEEQLEAERELTTLRASRTTQVERLNAEIAVLERDLLERAHLEEEVSRSRAALQERGNVERARTHAVEASARAREQSAAAVADMASVQIQAEKLQEKHARLEAAGSSCPLCDQPLSPTHRSTVESEITREVEELRGHYKELQKEAKARDVAAKAAAEEAAALSTTLTNLAAGAARAEALAARLVQLDEKMKELADRKTRLADVQAAPASPEEQALEARRATLERKRQLLKYSPEEHADVRRVAERLAPVFERAKELETAEERLSALAAQRTTLLERVALKRARLTDLQKEQEDVARSLEGSSLVQDNVVLRSAEVEAARAVLREKERTAATLRSVTDGLRAKSARAEELRAGMKESDLQRSLLEELRQAFSRNGIPAMLIEAAVPEIEERANEILGRMTDHQMSVRLELQRQKRSGVGTVETLDIRISDAEGTRDYELFSGGEAFRINFALRIALSRLLARKAGTELRLLIIDEGFGSQDVTGRETLVTVLNAIRQDFEKVLVVTHVEELQDAFSYQLRIEKRPGGSVIVRD